MFGLRAALEQHGIWRHSKAKRIGEDIENAKPFPRGHLYRILNNPLYRGKVRHRGIVYEGNHDPIVDEEIWETVQATLKNNCNERVIQSNAKVPSLLTGLIENENGIALVSDHANKGGKRYRYYIDREAVNSKQKTSTQKHNGWRIPAQQIEQLIILALCDLLKTAAKLMELCGTVLHGKPNVDRLLVKAHQFGERLPQYSVTEQRALLLQLIQKVIIDESQLSIYVLQDGVINLITGEKGNIEKPEESIADLAKPLIVPWQVRRRGVEMKLIVPGPLQTEQRNLDKALIRAIAKGHLWMEQITSGQVKTLAEIARQNNVQGRWVSKLINLACLAPDIVERILDGTQPPHLTLQKLLVQVKLPADWQAQRDLLLA